MKTLCTIIAALCITATTFAQTVTEKETSIKITSQERAQIQELKDVIVKLSENVSESLQEKETLSRNEITMLKKLLNAIDTRYAGEEIRKKIIVKAENPTKKTSISYAFSIDNDGEATPLEGTENIDLSALKEKLTALSISISDSDAVKEMIEKLKDTDTVIFKEIEGKKEKKEKTKH